jgi:hypothetical protein
MNRLANHIKVGAVSVLAGLAHGSSFPDIGKNVHCSEWEYATTKPDYFAKKHLLSGLKNPTPQQLQKWTRAQWQSKLKILMNYIGPRCNYPSHSQYGEILRLTIIKCTKDQWNNQLFNRYYSAFVENVSASK